ncbi:MAG: serine/threonine protein kinase, partial [Phycisphaerales bacterium]|nr:serine/threonine protein kinase [Phycisphaerales bacterium]
MLTPDQYKSARELFERARDAAPEGRAGIIDTCPDPAIRDEVRSLLQIDAEDSGFLRGPALGAGAAREAAASLLADDDDALVGRVIDDFEIQRVIASGGMGTVYLARQRVTQRQVALKLMRQGLTSTQALRRFEYETRILGRLRHPNIAQIHDSGVWDAGPCRVPWFAMEYVANSRTIIDYAGRAHLDRRARLELFLTVCDAVSHGHQKGIIHRDLKPANILVDDGGGQRGATAKVIDFGVAKSTDADLALTTMHTNAGQLIGTLPYMSPEQCGGDSDQVDVRSDVYALGVVLYELLT